MNVTLSIDDKALERAREVACRRGRSLDDMIREYIDWLAGEASRAEAAAEIERLWEESSGDSGARRVSRVEAYEGRT